MSVTVTGGGYYFPSFTVTCKAANLFFDEPHSGPYKDGDTIDLLKIFGDYFLPEELLEVKTLITNADNIYDRIISETACQIYCHRYPYPSDGPPEEDKYTANLLDTVRTSFFPSIVEYYNGADLNFDTKFSNGIEALTMIRQFVREGSFFFPKWMFSEVVKICSPYVHFLFKMTAKTGEDVVRILTHIGDNGCYRWIDCIDHTFDEWDWFKEIYKDNTSLTPDFFKYLLTLKYPRLNEKKPMKKVKRKRVVDEDND